MNAERKYIRELVKKSLRANFEKIVSEAKLTEQEEAVVRMVIIRKASTVETSLKLNISESTVYRIMREFYERAAVILESWLSSSESKNQTISDDFQTKNSQKVHFNVLIQTILDEFQTIAKVSESNKTIKW